MTDAQRTLVDHDDGLTEGLTLLPQTDPAARKAIETYIEATDDEAVATELQAWLDRCSDQEIRTDGGTALTELAASHRDVLATIAALYEDGPPQGSTVAANCRVGEDHIYHVLKVLDKRGYIERQADPADERLIRAALTEQGIAALEQLQAQYAAVDLTAVNAATATSRTDDSLRTDGGRPRSCPTDATPTLSVSLLVDTPTTTIDTDGEATIRVRPDHGGVRIEAAEDGDRTAEAVLAGSPVAMVSLADKLYAAAAEATTDDPPGGDRNE